MSDTTALAESHFKGDARFERLVFGGTRGLPAAEIAAAVREDGAALLRQAVPRHIVRHYQNTLGHEAALARETRDGDAMRPIFARSNRNLLTRHSVSDIEDPLGRWFAQTPLATATRIFLGRDTLWVGESAYFREVLPPSSLKPAPDT
jgi:hypothetical protein